MSDEQNEFCPVCGDDAPCSCKDAYDMECWSCKCDPCQCEDEDDCWEDEDIWEGDEP